MQSVEVRHSGHGVVPHAVVYIRAPRDTWTRGPTKADILMVGFFDVAVDASVDKPAFFVR